MLDYSIIHYFSHQLFKCSKFEPLASLATSPLPFTSNYQIPSSDPPSILPPSKGNSHFGPWRPVLRLSIHILFEFQTPKSFPVVAMAPCRCPQGFVPPLAPPRTIRVVRTSWCRYPTSTFHVHSTINVADHPLPPFTSPFPQAPCNYSSRDHDDSEHDLSTIWVIFEWTFTSLVSYTTTI